MSRLRVTVILLVAMLGLVQAGVRVLDTSGGPLLSRHRRQSLEEESAVLPKVFRGKSEEKVVVPPVLSERDLDVGASNAYHKGYHKPGKVGPVYTFVKTDYHGNAKWGVRHVVGKKYAGHH